VEDRQEEGPTTPGTGGDVHCRIGSMTGERQTTVETNHWPQRPTWVMSSKEEVVLTTLVGE